MRLSHHPLRSIDHDRPDQPVAVGARRRGQPHQFGDCAGRRTPTAEPWSTGDRRLPPGDGNGRNLQRAHWRLPGALGASCDRRRGLQARSQVLFFDHDTPLGPRHAAAPALHQRDRSGRRHRNRAVPVAPGGQDRCCPTTASAPRGFQIVDGKLKALDPIPGAYGTAPQPPRQLQPPRRNTERSSIEAIFDLPASVLGGGPGAERRQVGVLLALLVGVRMVYSGCSISASAQLLRGSGNRRRQRPRRAAAACGGAR